MLSGHPELKQLGVVEVFTLGAAVQGDHRLHRAGVPV
jgi:hypothetical protein